MRPTGSAIPVFHEFRRIVTNVLLRNPLMCRGRVVGAINLQLAALTFDKQREIR